MTDKTNNLTNQNWKELIDLIQDHSKSFITKLNAQLQNGQTRRIY